MYEYPPGATPLDPDEAAGLIPMHITTQSQLNEWEQMNILEAEKWIGGKHFELANILNSEFIKKLHLRMFNNTWRWAGEFRKSNKNIGVDWPTIAIELRLLVDDVEYQLSNSTYADDELATRFHHRLVAVHPFANGNGRHARMMTDILLLSLGQKRFSWGGVDSLVKPSVIRKNYITALRAADRKDYSLLLAFVRN